MKFIFLIFIIILYTAIPINAQSIIKGLIFDSKGSKVLNSNIFILNPKTNSIISTVNTGDTNIFIDTLTVNVDSLIIIITNIEFMNYKRTIVNQSSDINIHLNRIMYESNAIEITSKKIIYKNEKNKIIYLNKNDSLNTRSTANELINKLPLIASNKIEYIDGRKILIMVNGKEDNILNENNELLKTINNKDINRIEFIYNPNVNYINRGYYGIINIIKESEFAGSLLMLNTNFSFINILKSKNKLNFLLKSKKYLINITTEYDYSKYDVEINNSIKNNTIDKFILLSRDLSNYNYNYLRLNLSSSYFINNKNKIDIAFNHIYNPIKNNIINKFYFTDTLNAFNLYNNFINSNINLTNLAVGYTFNNNHILNKTNIRLFNNINNSNYDMFMDSLNTRSNEITTSVGTLDGEIVLKTKDISIQYSLVNREYKYFTNLNNNRDNIILNTIFIRPSYTINKKQITYQISSALDISSIKRNQTIKNNFSLLPRLRVILFNELGDFIIDLRKIQLKPNQTTFYGNENNFILPNRTFELSRDLNFSNFYILNLSTSRFMEKFNYRIANESTYSVNNIDKVITNLSSTNTSFSFINSSSFINQSSISMGVNPVNKLYINNDFGIILNNLVKPINKFNVDLYGSCNLLYILNQKSNLSFNLDYNSGITLIQGKSKSIVNYSLFYGYKTHTGKLTFGALMTNFIRNIQFNSEINTLNNLTEKYSILTKQRRVSINLNYKFGKLKETSKVDFDINNLIDDEIKLKN